MIISALPSKDTYITNLHTNNQDSSNSNVGKAATLDLFKLYNENNQAKSWTAIKFSGEILLQGAEFFFIDADDQKIRLVVDNNVTSISQEDFDLDVNGLPYGSNAENFVVNKNLLIVGEEYIITETNDGNGGLDTDFTKAGAAINEAGHKFTAINSGSTLAGTGSIAVKNAIVIGINNVLPQNYSTLFKNIINNINLFENSLTLSINAYNNSNNVVVLKQEKSGIKGDTKYHIPDGVTNFLENNSRFSFSRIEYSCVLIKFDLEKIKSVWFNSIDDQDPPNFLGVISNSKFFLTLKDITSGLNKPKDYSIEIKSLKKDFNEGNGKDTIYFSDFGTASFVNINKSDSWVVPGFVSNVDEVENIDTSEFKIDIGDENLIFDITNYVINKIKQEEVQDFGLLIKISDENLYDDNTYFVKRLGSRHLINKDFSPELLICFDETSSFIDNNKKNRYLNNEESFYLFNNFVDSDFSSPGNNFNLYLKIFEDKNSSVTLFDIQSHDVVNYKGEKTAGLAKALVTINEYQSQVENKVLNNEYNTKITWYWKDEITNLINSTDLVSGKKYKILNPGSLDYTQVGSLTSDINEVFTSSSSFSLDVINEQDFAQGVLVEIIEKNIASEDVTFLKSVSFQREDDFSNILVSCKTNTGDNVVKHNKEYSLNTYFIDSKKSNRASKMAMELHSEYLGEHVYYDVFTSENNRKVWDNDLFRDSKKLKFDGVKYVFNFYPPESLKSKSIYFEFYFYDKFSNKMITKKINSKKKNKFRIE